MLSTTSASAAVGGHVRFTRQLMPTTCICILLASIRPVTTAASMVSPSAASTQVVPNGGKGRTKHHKKAGTVANYHIANAPAKIISNFYYSIRLRLAPAISILSSSMI